MLFKNPPQANSTLQVTKVYGLWSQPMQRGLADWRYLID